MAAFGANWRHQSEHAFDPEGHLRCSFGNYNFAVRSGMPRQIDSSYVAEIEKITLHQLCRLVRRASQTVLEIVADPALQIDRGTPAGKLLKQT